MVTRGLIKSLIHSLLLTYISTQAFGAQDNAQDIPAQIKGRAIQREQTLWTPLKIQNATFFCGQPVKLTKKMDIIEKGNTLDFAIYRPSHQKNKGTSVKTAIPYIVCLSEDVQTGMVSPKGVIIKVYGAGIPLALKNDTLLREEKLWAAHDYIVYCLNLRGTEGFGHDFLHAQGQSHAVQSLVRDISYFTYLLRNGEQDIDGHSAIGSNLVTKDTPCFLEGSSFGGYLTLFHATNPEDNFFLKQFNVTIKHRELFDGYMASMPVTDVWRDVKSGTTVGSLRLPFFTQGTSHTWMKNAFQGKNVVDQDADNISLSPLYRMDKLVKPVLFLHGIQDTNVSPKQTIDCIKAGIFHNTHDKIFLYMSHDLGHHFPKSTPATIDEYEMTFRFMDGAALARSGAPFTSSDKLADINAIAHLRMRALNPDVKRPIYEFMYGAIHTYRTKRLKNFNQVWKTLKELNSHSFLKALVWMKEKERISFDRQDRRKYLKQKDAMKQAYASTLTGDHGLADHGRLVDYLGDGIAMTGEAKLLEYENAIKTKLQTTMKSYRHGLIVGTMDLSTRLGM